VELDANSEHYLACVSKNRTPEGGINVHLNCGLGSDGIYNCRPESKSDTAEALDTARAMFHSTTYDLQNNGRSRTPARKVIIFLTASEPTGGITSSEAQETLRRAGQGHGGTSGNTCESDGIAIFTIGLDFLTGKAFNTLKEHQSLLLSDKPSFTQGGGLAFRAGHCGRYYPCETKVQLKSAFSDIARRFSQCQR
jgi:hypothetical protein